MADAFLNFQVQVKDYEKFDAAINRFANLTGQSLKRIARRETRAVIYTVYRFTAPKNLEQGENAIARDLMRVFSPISDGYFDQVSDFTGGQRQARLVLRRKDGTPYLVDWDYLSANLSEMATFHQGKRISRGRVQHAGSLGSRTKDIGRWKEDSRMVVPHGAFSRYLKIVHSRVGLGKSGWLPAMNALGISADPFVTRHGSRNGTVINNLNSDSAPHFVATNKVSYVAENTRAIDNAVRSRRKYLEGEIEKLLVANAATAGLS